VLLCFIFVHISGEKSLDGEEHKKRVSFEIRRRACVLGNLRKEGLHADARDSSEVRTCFLRSMSICSISSLVGNCKWDVKCSSMALAPPPTEGPACDISCRICSGSSPFSLCWFFHSSNSAPIAVQGGKKGEGECVSVGPEMGEKRAREWRSGAERTGRRVKLHFEVVKGDRVQGSIEKVCRLVGSRACGVETGIVLFWGASLPLSELRNRS